LGPIQKKKIDQTKWRGKFLTGAPIYALQNDLIHATSKGGLISESFLVWLKSPKMGAKSQPSTQIKEKMLRIWYPLFWRFEPK
jgi:hypothetical protein